MRTFNVVNVYDYEEVLTQLGFTPNSLGATYDWQTNINTILSGLINIGLTGNDKTYFNEAMGCLFSRNRKLGVFECASDDVNDVDADLLKECIYDIVEVMFRYRDKYLKMLKYYRASENNLLDKIETTGGRVIKNNNTPQSNDSNDVYADMPYVNNSTKELTETGTDGGTLMARLNEIQSQYRNVISDWCDEASGLFLY